VPGETAASCSVRALNSPCATAAVPLTRRARRQVSSVAHMTRRSIFFFFPISFFFFIVLFCRDGKLGVGRCRGRSASPRLQHDIKRISSRKELFCERLFHLCNWTFHFAVSDFCLAFFFVLSFWRKKDSKINSRETSSF
jgi:hypothetical protein